MVCGLLCFVVCWFSIWLIIGLLFVLFVIVIGYLDLGLLGFGLLRALSLVDFPGLCLMVLFDLVGFWMRVIWVGGLLLIWVYLGLC